MQTADAQGYRPLFRQLLFRQPLFRQNASEKAQLTLTLTRTLTLAQTLTLTITLTPTLTGIAVVGIAAVGIVAASQCSKAKTRNLEKAYRQKPPNESRLAGQAQFADQRALFHTKLFDVCYRLLSWQLQGTVVKAVELD